MGYTTEFKGRFKLDRPLAPAQRAYLKQFAETRRMKRDPEIAVKLPDPLRLAAKLPIGPEACYYVGPIARDDAHRFGQFRDASILEYSTPPIGQPSLWCQWVPWGPTGIAWSRLEKFYNYDTWLKYLIKHFLQPWGYTLNGSVQWQGEDPDDRGTLVVVNNAVRMRKVIASFEVTEER